MGGCLRFLPGFLLELLNLKIFVSIEKRDSREEDEVAQEPSLLFFF